MKPRIILVLITCCMLISICVLIAENLNTYIAKPDIVEINRIRVNVESCVDFSDFDINAQYDFTVVSYDGAVVYSTKNTSQVSFNERINQATANYDSIVDCEISGQTHKIIMYTGQILQGNRMIRLVSIIIPFAAISVLLVFYYLHIRIYIYSPFKKLKRFASEVAAGNLDIPLLMDKDNLFGEFTESFDLMRSELREARLKAVMEEKSKKELIAALSHDIRTPISIIRVASELLYINENEEKKLANIKAIQIKTAEIDRLVTDLFSSALEDLSELKINVQDVDALIIEKLIHDADPLGKINVVSIVPNCLIKADALRLSQVFGNIVSNSYKYAGTQIDVSAVIIDSYLKITFKDYGTTLSKEDLLVITKKFCRGKNAEGKDGAGLGLYICAKLIDCMGGSLDTDLDFDGFRVDISLALS